MQAKKSLGQHFLHSPQIIADIVKAGKVTRNKTVLEIGPGKGVLTSALLSTGAKVIAVEKDDRLIPELKEKFEKEIKSGKLILVHGDILALPMSRLNLDILDDYKIIANIPYYITGQILRKFLETNNQPESMTLLIQKEVAERIVARPARRGGRDGKESLLSLSVKIFGTPKYIRTVGRGAFSPQPNVDSAVLNIENISRKKLSGVDEKMFFKIIHAGFAHKRKQVLPNLSSLYKKEILIEVFEKCGVDLKTRAEDLSLETWIKLCKTTKL